MLCTIGLYQTGLPYNRKCFSVNYISILQPQNFFFSMLNCNYTSTTKVPFNLQYMIIRPWTTFLQDKLTHKLKYQCHTDHHLAKYSSVSLSLNYCLKYNVATHPSEEIMTDPCTWLIHNYDNFLYVILNQVHAWFIEVALLVFIISRCGLSIDVYHRNQPNKSKLVLHKPSLSL